MKTEPETKMRAMQPYETLDAVPAPLLDIRDLRVSFDTPHGLVKAVGGVSWSLSPGETLGIIGPNGSGKSTIFNTISGLLKPKAGTIEFEGERIDREPSHKIVGRGLSHILERRRVFPYLSVKQNLWLGGYNPQAKAHRDDTLEEVYGLFPRLRERKDQLAHSLSGGEQQMVAIGRAVMARPRLLLLDEPSGGLAPQFINEIGTIIQALKDDGATMLMVEQNLALAFKVADRFIILRDGVVSDGGFVKSLEGNHDEIVRTIYL